MKSFGDITDPALAKALTHPLRAQILSALDGRTASPSELAGELSAPLGVTSYHVRRLESLGFLKLVKRVPRRGAIEHYYTAKPRPSMTDGRWASTSGAVRQASVAAALDDIGQGATAAAASGGFDGKAARIARVPVTLDAEGWKTLSRELDQLAKRTATLAAESRRRLAAGGSSGQAASLVMLLFEDAGSD